MALIMEAPESIDTTAPEGGAGNDLVEMPEKMAAKSLASLLASVELMITAVNETSG
jgi:hypothetical protein